MRTWVDPGCCLGDLALLSLKLGEGKGWVGYCLLARLCFVEENRSCSVSAPVFLVGGSLVGGSLVSGSLVSGPLVSGPLGPSKYLHGTIIGSACVGRARDNV